MENYRFTFQQNQFNGECLPCTLTTFRNIVKSENVAWRISTRQAVEQALALGLSLDMFAGNSNFKKFCERPRAGESFKKLTLEQKLQQWVNDLKMWLPCFIFAIKDFEAVPKTDKQGNPVVDAEGKPVMFRRRKQPNIKALSGLFMFDADHLTVDPREVYERTKRKHFPWAVRLAHATSSGHGLRLVCEARTEVGNIADNQIELARELGLLGVKGSTGKPVTDDSCIDATRISYAPRECDIYYIDENHLFNPIHF